LFWQYLKNSKYIIKMNADLQEFNEIFSNLHVSLQNKVNLMLTNYQLEKDRFLDIYRLYEYNLGKDRENQSNIQIPLE